MPSWPNSWECHWKQVCLPLASPEWHEEWMNKWRNTCMLGDGVGLLVQAKFGCKHLNVSRPKWMNIEWKEIMKECLNAVIKWSLNWLPDAQISSDMIGQNPSWFGCERSRRSSSCFVMAKNARHWMAYSVGQNRVVFLVCWASWWPKRCRNHGDVAEIGENEAVFLLWMTWPWPGFLTVLSAIFFCSVIIFRSALACTCTVACRILLFLYYKSSYFATSSSITWFYSN